MSKPSYSPDALADISNIYVERKVQEHYRIDRLAKANADALAYEVLANDKLYPHPPVHYRIKYFLKSFTGIRDDQTPITGVEHILDLKIPKQYSDFPVEALMLTDTWHPNIKSSGAFKGHICSNTKDFGGLFSLDELIVRIGEILQYKRYMAEDRPPWPEDDKVAKWVRGYAEPEGIVSRKKGVSVDDYVWEEFFDGGYPEPEPQEEEDDIIFFEASSSDSENAQTDETTDVAPPAASKVEEKNEEDNEQKNEDEDEITFF